MGHKTVQVADGVGGVAAAIPESFRISGRGNAWDIQVTFIDLFTRRRIVVQRRGVARAELKVTMGLLLDPPEGEVVGNE